MEIPNDVIIQLRDELQTIPGFTDKLARLNAFCHRHTLQLISSLRFNEWVYSFTDFDGDQHNRLVNNLVPLVPKDESERIQFNQWAVAYYQKTYPDASFEGLKKAFDEMLQDAPYPDKFIDHELSKAQRKLNGYTEPDFSKGYHERIRGKAFDLTRQPYYAYRSGFLDELRGRALADYIPFLENATTRKFRTEGKQQEKQEKKTKSTQTRDSTIQRHTEYREYYNNLTKIENHTREEATKATIQKYSISEKTLYRALGWNE